MRRGDHRGSLWACGRECVRKNVGRSQAESQFENNLACYFTKLTYIHSSYQFSMFVTRICFTGRVLVISTVRDVPRLVALT
jgi:hypothetical protein